MMRGVRNRFGRPAGVLSALLLAAVSAAACSSAKSTGAGGGGASGSVKDLLAHIQDTPQTSKYLEFGNTAQVTKLNGGTGPASSGPFSRLIGRGAPNISSYSQVIVAPTGIDPNSATSAVSVGAPPNSVEVLYGSFDADAIGAKLAAWGYRKQDRGGGVTAWVWSDDHKFDLSKLDPNTGIGPGMTGGWLDVAWVSKTRIAYGRATSDLAAALPEQSKPLSGDPVVGPLADCLGSALAGAMVTDQAEIKDPSVSAMAIGVTATSAADVRQEFCVSAPDDASVQTFAAAFTKEIESGEDFVNNVQWSTELSNPKADLLGGPQHVVRLSATPVDPAQSGLVFDLVDRDDYKTLLGLPMKAKNGTTVYPDGTSSPAPSSSSS
jgi:hypothetical protein